MKDAMEYKGYYGSVHYNDDDEIFYGKVEFIKSLINYEGTNVKSLRKAFAEAVDDYINYCETKKLTPEEPFKGSFNIRTGSKLHKQIAIYATENKTSLNKVVIDALEKYLKKQG